MYDDKVFAGPFSENETTLVNFIDLHNGLCNTCKREIPLPKDYARVDNMLSDLRAHSGDIYFDRWNYVWRHVSPLENNLYPFEKRFLDLLDG